MLYGGPKGKSTDSGFSRFQLCGRFRGGNSNRGERLMSGTEIGTADGVQEDNEGVRIKGRQQGVKKKGPR